MHFVMEEEVTGSLSKRLDHIDHLFKYGWDFQCIGIVIFSVCF